MLVLILLELRTADLATAEKERQPMLIRYMFRRLAWALVTGSGSWCAEAAARRDIELQGPAARRQVFRHLDAWLHANAYSSRTFHAMLLDRLKVFSNVYSLAMFIVCAQKL